MKEIIYIAIGGAIGAIARYMVSGIAYNYFGTGFPWGTLTVNLIGTFFMGFLWTFFDRMSFFPEIKVFVFIGFFGAFTTFSTYGFETLNFLHEKEIKLAVINFLANNIIGIGFVYLGMMVSKYIIFILERGAKI